MVGVHEHVTSEHAAISLTDRPKLETCTNYEQMLQQRVAYAQWAHSRLSRLPIVQLARQDKRTWIATLPLHVQCVPSGTTLQSPSICALLALQVWWMQTLTQRQSAPHAPLVVFLPPKLCLASIVLRVSTIMIAMLPPDAMHVWPEGLLLVLLCYQE